MNEPHQYAEDVQELVQLLHENRTLNDFRDAFSVQYHLQEFASRATFQFHEQGTQIFRQGQAGKAFCLVMDGQLRAIDLSGKEPRLLGYLPAGSFVGEGAMLGKQMRSATVEVVIRAKLAWFTEADWDWLISKNSRLRVYFENLATSRNAQASIDFPGRQWDEVVVASTKRNIVAYLATLFLPTVLLILPVLLLLLAFLFDPDFLSNISTGLLVLITVPFFFVAMVLAVFNYFDWKNDDFIVTTKRVVHIERFLFFGEQREDAPLTRIQDVTLLSDLFDYIFDSDTLKITTAGVGVIVFDHVRQAEHIQRTIFQERRRAMARVTAADTAVLRHKLANQIEVVDQVEQNVMAVAEAEATLIKQPTTRHYGPLIDYFIPRIKEVNNTKDGTVITWRKHYYVLLVDIALPVLALLISLYLFLASLVLWLPPFGPAVAWSVHLLLGIAIGASYFWYLVRYDDWNKDVYMLTDSRIIDIEAAAFRIRRSRREGTFDNIQSVYSEIPNLFYKLINLGDVIIETAGSEETFTFEKVFDPASVREEVFNRWAIYQQKQKEAMRDATNQQVMDAVTEYHKLTNQPSP
jgi:uncharacterized membrane protein YdbT with pleckstrin-like domain